MKKRIKTHKELDYFHEQPLNHNRRNVLAGLIKTGIYLLIMRDESMAPLVSKEDILIFEEGQSVGDIV